VEETTDHLWWLVLSCSPRLRRGEHVELFEKLEGKVFKQRWRLIVIIVAIYRYDRTTACGALSS